MKNITMDNTVLSSLMGCGKLTDYRFNEHLQDKDGKSNALETGSIAHAFLEYYYQGLIDGKSKSDSMDLGVEAAMMYIKGCPVCKELPIDFIGIPSCGHKNGDWTGVRNTPAENEKQKYREIIGWKYVINTCTQYLSRWNSDTWTPIRSEYTKGEVIYQDDEIRVLWKAKFDLIVDTNGGLLSVDHKTMKQRRESISLNNQFMGQCVLMNSRNIIINKIGFQSSLPPEQKFERAIISYSKERLEEWKNEIVPYWAYKLVEYNKTGFWPRNFTHCETKFGFCAFKEVCENNPNMREDIKKLNFVVGKPWDISND
jgi:hypothetical protein